MTPTLLQREALADQVFRRLELVSKQADLLIMSPDKGIDDILAMLRKHVHELLELLQVRESELEVD